MAVILVHMHAWHRLHAVVTPSACLQDVFSNVQSAPAGRHGGDGQRSGAAAARDQGHQFLTVLKPCTILLPHTHQRANEFYSVIFGARLPACWSSQCIMNLPPLTRFTHIQQWACAAVPVICQSRFVTAVFVADRFSSFCFGLLFSENASEL